MSARIDYDAIAHLYDDRRRDHDVDPHLVAFVATRGGDERLRVVDVGCGTGKQLAADRARFPRMTLVGVDRSAGMLQVARRRAEDVSWVQGDAQTLPLATASVDYATNQFSYPHISDKRRFAAEVFRVLRPGGRLVVTNIDPWEMPGWVIYRFFPEAVAIDHRDFLPRPALAALLTGAGFVAVDARSVDLSRDEPLAGVLASVSQRHSASQLTAISDAAYAAGLRRIEEAVAREGADAGVRSQFVRLTVRADKPA
jgi:SAM-dependent methyltransferase